MYAPKYYLPMMACICLPFASVLGNPRPIETGGSSTLPTSLSPSTGGTYTPDTLATSAQAGSSARAVCNQFWSIAADNKTAQCQDIDQPMQTCELKKCTVVVNERGDEKPAESGLKFSNCHPGTETPPEGPPPKEHQPKGSQPKGTPPNGPPPKGTPPKGTVVIARSFRFSGDGDFISVNGTDGKPFMCFDNSLRPGCDSCKPESKI